MKNLVIFLTIIAGSSDAFVVPNPRFNHAGGNRMAGGNTALQMTKEIVDAASAIRALGVAAVLTVGADAWAVTAPPLVPPLETTVVQAANTLNMPLPTTSEKVTTKAIAGKAPGTSTAEASKPIQKSTGPVAISAINYDGLVKYTEADEYIEIATTSAQQDISGWKIVIGTNDKTFEFPAKSMIRSDANVRVYTNEIHKETGGFNFESGKALWNNKGGVAQLFDASGKEVSTFSYGRTP